MPTWSPICSAGCATPGTWWPSCSKWEVAENEDFGKAGGIEIAVDDDAAALVGGCSNHLAERGSLHARSPQNDSGLDTLVVSFDPAGSHVGDVAFGVHFYAQVEEFLLSFCGEVLGIRGENARTIIEK